MTIEQQIEELIRIEGGYVDHPSDRGGATRFGITQAVARANGYAGPMKALPIDLARAIYRRQYWTDPHFDEVAKLAPRAAAELFDTGINCGTAAAVMILQRALNALEGKALKRDGRLLPGGATFAVLAAYLRRRGAEGEAVLVELLNGLQAERYVEIVEGDARQRDFVFGWIRNRVMTRAA